MPISARIWEWIIKGLIVLAIAALAVFASTSVYFYDQNRQKTIQIAAQQEQIEDTQRQVRRLAMNNQRVLCGQKINVEKQIEASENLLEHPEDIQGISVQVIKDSIARQKAFLEAYKGYPCPSQTQP